MRFKDWKELEGQNVKVVILENVMLKDNKYHFVCVEDENKRMDIVDKFVVPPKEVISEAEKTCSNCYYWVDNKINTYCKYNGIKECIKNNKWESRK